jgi:hypothetical protein
MTQVIIFFKLKMEFRLNDGIPPLDKLRSTRKEKRQVSHTHCKFTIFSKSGHPLFKASVKGTDHSLKSYFYYLQILKLDTYFSDPYTSLATGCICRTMSAVYQIAEGASRILCVDFNV